jgi:sodium/proline symporter
LPIALVIGAYLNWTFVAARLRVYTEVAKNSITLPMYLTNRFHDRGDSIKIITAIAILIFFTFYSVTGFVAGAELVKLIFHSDYLISLYIIAAVIVAYTVIGGFLAVSWIDFFQGSLMLVSLIVVPIVTFYNLGSIDSIVYQLKAYSINYFDLFSGVKILGLISLLGWGLGYFGQPHILIRFMAIRSHKELPVARNICTIWMIISLIGAILTGGLGAAFYLDNPLSNSETVFLALSQTLFNPWIAGILLSAVLSAIMSTVSALLLMSTSALVEDIYHRLITKKIHAKKVNYMLISRIGMLFIAGISVAIAAKPSTTILSAVAFAWSGLGASFGAVIIFSLFWRRMTGSAAIFGIAVGMLSVIIWDFIAKANVELFTELGFLPGFEIIPGFILSTLAIIIVSLNSKPPANSILQEFDEVVKICSS